jgi:hypothetical protein
MPSRILITALIVVVIAVAIGPAAAPAAVGPCALLTPDDIVAVLGQPVTWSSAGAATDTSCTYSTQAGSDAIHFEIGGGRAEFDNTIRTLKSDGAQYHLPPLVAMSGVGDAAYLNTSGTDSEQVYVIQGRTYFAITLFCERAKCADQLTALARKVANRIKTK